MCDHCHRSCCYCGPCYPRRCVSCIAFCRCEPCSTESSCHHCCWTTCPCCCRRTCRSHSFGGVPLKKSSEDREIRLRKVTGFYMKMQDKSTAGLYRKTTPTSRPSRSRGRRGQSERDQHNASNRCKTNDHLQHLMGSPNFTENTLRALLECVPVEACDSYEDFKGVPFTYYPKYLLGGPYQPTCRKSAKGDYLDALKRRLLSRKNVERCARRDMLNKNLLGDLNKLYATVGGGMVQTAKGTLEPIPLQHLQQMPEYHAVAEYHAFFGGRQRSRHGRLRKLSSQRTRSGVLRKSRINHGIPRNMQQRDLSEMDGDRSGYRSPRDMRQYDLSETGSFRPHHQSDASRDPRSSRKGSSYVYMYPTRLDLPDRARLSSTSENRVGLFGSRILKKRDSSRLELFEKRHVIDLDHLSKALGSSQA